MSEQAAKTAQAPNTKRKHIDDGVRKRVSQACDACRNKKLKCDGLRPTCTSCISLGRQCLYGSVVKKRGLPEGYVRGLEKLMALLILKGEDGIVTSIFQSALNDDVSRMDLIQQWNGETNGETLPEFWRNSPLSKALERLLPDLEAADAKGQEFKKPRLEPHSVDYTKDKVTSNPIPQLPSREEAETLFNIYFAYTHCWLPIVGKDELLAAYYRTLELSESCLASGERAALWALFAYAKTQLPTVPTNDSHLQADTDSSASPDLYYERARTLIPLEDSNLQVGHVQALLLLSLFKLRLGRLSVAWLLVGHAVNIAIDIGLGVPSKNASSGDFNGRRNHVFLGCFCLDTLIATGLGRFPHLRQEDAALVGSLSENGLEEWGRLECGDHWPGKQPGPTRSISTFNHLIRLLRVVNEYIRNSLSDEDRGLVFSKTLTRLRQWATALPPHCSLKAITASQNTTTLPHHFNLHVSLSMCLTLLVAQSNGTQNLDKPSEFLQVPRKVSEELRTFSSNFGDNFFPSAVYIFARSILPSNSDQDLGSQQITLRESLDQLCPAIDDIWTKAGVPNTDLTHLQQRAEIPSSIVIDSRGRQKSLSAEESSLAVGAMNNKRNSFRFTGNTESVLPRDDHALVDQIQQQQQPSIDYNNMDLIMSTSPRNWGVSPASNATLAPPSDNMSIQGNIEGDSPWLTKDPSAYSAATDLFHFAQSNQAMPMMGQVDTQQIESLQNTLPVPDTMPGVIDGLSIDPALQNMTGTDDLFFELSNLDYYTGNRDETYRNLGFLLPTESQNPYTMQNQSGQSLPKYQNESYPPNDWTR